MLKAGGAMKDTTNAHAVVTDTAHRQQNVISEHQLMAGKLRRLEWL